MGLALSPDRHYLCCHLKKSKKQNDMNKKMSSLLLAYHGAQWNPLGYPVI